MRSESSRELSWGCCCRACAAFREATTSRLLRYAVHMICVAIGRTSYTKWPLIVSAVQNSLAILVDVGYVYAAGGLLVHDTSERRDLIVNPVQVRDLLRQFAEAHTKAEMLRMYWYDAAPNRVPSNEQSHAASVQGVKLRLGWLSGEGTQKGVDALIYRDLFTLSAKRAVSDVFLVAGDGDLLEGVEAAQEEGVRVHLIGVEPTTANQSVALRQAADSLFVLQQEQVADMLHRRRGAPAEQPRATPQQRESLKQHYEALEAHSEISDAENDSLRRIGGLVAHSFLDEAWDADLTDLEQNARLPETERRLPRHADGWLLTAASAEIGRSLTEDEKVVARQAFWKRTIEELGGR